MGVVIGRGYDAAMGSRKRWCLLAALLLSTAACERSPEQPNLLLIAVDTLRADHLGAYGYGRPTSPAIDALLAESVLFEDVQSSSAWTLPSFASLMTSLHPATHGCRNFHSGLSASRTTLAEILAEAGYETGAVVSHTFMDERYGLHQGFDDYDQDLVEIDMSRSHEAVTSPAVLERATAWLEARSGERPWFLWAHFFDPHEPYRRHPGVTERFGDTPLDRYDGEIAFTDAHIGKLLERADAEARGRETVVVFVTDHGEEFGEHGLFGHGRSLHREVTRLALGIRAPGVAAKRVAEPVHAVDLLPTLLELLAVPAPPELPLAGLSLVPVLEGRSAALLGRPLAAEIAFHRNAVGASYRVGRWKLFEHHPPEGPTRRRLFDVVEDVGETRDLAARHPERVRELAGALAQSLREWGALGRELGPPRSVRIGDAEVEQLRALGYVE